MEWIDLAQHRDRWRVLISAVSMKAHNKIANISVMRAEIIRPIGMKGLPACDVVQVCQYKRDLIAAD